MHKITLHNGTVLDNLELNGNNYISNTLIDDTVFVDNLATVQISDGVNTEYFEDMKLIANQTHDGKSWIILGEKTEQEKIIERLRMASQITIAKHLLANALTDAEIEDMVYLYPQFSVGVAYKVNDFIVYNGSLYEVIQSHVSQANWLPSETPTMFVLFVSKPTIKNIILSKNKETIIRDGTDTIAITATFEGEQVDTFTCYVTVNGPPAEAIPIINGQIVREFTSETPGLFKVEFYAGTAYIGTFIEVTEVIGS